MFSLILKKNAFLKSKIYVNSLFPSNTLMYPNMTYVWLKLLSRSSMLVSYQFLLFFFFFNSLSIFITYSKNLNCSENTGYAIPVQGGRA